MMPPIHCSRLKDKGPPQMLILLSGCKCPLWRFPPKRAALSRGLILDLVHKPEGFLSNSLSLLGAPPLLNFCHEKRPGWAIGLKVAPADRIQVRSCGRAGSHGVGVSLSNLRRAVLRRGEAARLRSRGGAPGDGCPDQQCH